jgi:hypothetical protein
VQPSRRKFLPTAGPPHGADQTSPPFFVIALIRWLPESATYSRPSPPAWIPREKKN